MTRARRGFTLLEISIVLAISAIAALLVFPQWVDRGDAILEPPAQMATWLISARQQAIAARQTVTVIVDARAARLHMDTSGSSGSGEWRSGELSRDMIAAFEPPGTRHTFTFRATGAARGDTVHMRTRDGPWQLTIDRWNGEVLHVAP